MFASLPMYDFPEVRDYTDAWWLCVQTHLKDQGFHDVPTRLFRPDNVKQHWRDNALLITQTCGFPLKYEFSDVLTALAVPDYNVAGCTPGTYASAIVVREDETASSFADLRGRRLVINSEDSQSGYNCIRDLVVALDTPGEFFAGMIVAGAHRSSLKTVKENAADVAAIDPVSLALVQRYAPEEFAGLKVLDWSKSVPALPYATRTAVDNDTRDRLRRGLIAAGTDEASRDIREALFIRAMLPIEDADYTPIVDMVMRSQQRHDIIVAG